MEHLLASFEGYQSSKDLVLNSKGGRKGNSNLTKAYYFQTVSDYI